MNNIREQLFKLNNEQYKKFSEKIINTKYEIIGVKTDILKKIAKENINNYQEYFKEKHLYYEEYMIHGFMLGYLKLPYEEVINYVSDYIEYIDCWSMVDSIVSNLKMINKNIEKAFITAKEYINTNSIFRIRFGYCIVLSYFINYSRKEYLDQIIKLCDKPHKDYYIQMMVAWLLSVAYVKFKEETLLYIKDNKLDIFTHNKTISKICDSYRVSKEEKIILKEMRRKNE